MCFQSNNMLIAGGFLYLVVLIAGTKAQAQSTCNASSYGTEFVFGFMDLKSYPSRGIATDPTLSLHINSLLYSTNVQVSVPDTSSSASKTPVYVTTSLYVYKHKDIAINSSSINRYQDKTTGGAIRITSRDPISVVAVYKTTEYVVTCPILPASALGLEYAIPSYQPNRLTESRTQFMFVALNDSTEVRIEGFDTGNMVENLNKNEVYVYERQLDLSGSLITSNHPIAVFSSVTLGDLHQFSSHQQLFSQNLVVQAMPFGGTHFIVPQVVAGDILYSYSIRIYAETSDAHVQIFSSATSFQHVYVYKKIFYEKTVRADNTLEILSDVPITVVQIALSKTGTAQYMTNIPAVSQYLTKYVTESIEGLQTYTVIIRSDVATGLLLDGSPMLHNPEQIGVIAPLRNFTILSIPMSSRGTVTHAGNEPFGLLINGRRDDRTSILSPYYAFAYPAGMAFSKTSGCGLTTDPSSSFVGKR